LRRMITDKNVLQTLRMFISMQNCQEKRHVYAYPIAVMSTRFS